MRTAVPRVRGTALSLAAGTATLLSAVVVAGVLAAPTAPVAAAAPPAAEPTSAPPPVARCVLDVAFVIDDTGSMGGAIANIQAGINSIIGNVVTASGGNYQLGVVTFKDNVTVVDDLAPGNQAAVTASINALAAGGGAGVAEASDEALNTVVNNLAAGPPRPQTGNFFGTWRSNAVKIAVLVTDAPPGGFDDVYTVGVDDANAALRANQAQANGIRIGAVYVPTNPGMSPTIVPIMQNYATTTGGIYTQTAADGTGTANAIQAIIDDCRNRTDVFIRDYVGDTGVEPHSNSVWYSPDIKVCPTSVECAVSQNPVVGVTNYIFVKLNNPGPYGTGTATGNVHVYRSSPGGGTTWPTVPTGDWTPIGTATGVTVPMGPPTTVMIPWTGVPGPGHFCLLARWVSGSDPMTFAEGPNTVLNTQRNNNIAWRNVDSVRLRPNTSTTRPYSIGNPLTVQTMNDLVLTHRDSTFLGAGRVIVDLGPDLFQRWRASGGRGEGIRQVGTTQLEVIATTAALRDIALRPKERVQLTLIFVAGAAETSREGVLHVVQLGQDEEDTPATAPAGTAPGTNATKVDIGGVEYRILISRN